MVPVKKERIFRTICLKKEVGIIAIAKETGLAKSYVSRVMKNLREKGIIFSREVNYELLLREWGEVKRVILDKLKPMKLDILIPERIKNVLKNYAISGPFAEMLIQGESSGRPLIVYLSETEFEKRKRDLMRVGKIGRGQVWVYVYDEDIFKQTWKLRGWKVVSIPQVSADLVALGTYADLGMKLFKRWLDVSGRI